jgi:hypothetical protein
MEAAVIRPMFSRLAERPSGPLVLIPDDVR